MKKRKFVPIIILLFLLFSAANVMAGFYQIYLGRPGLHGEMFIDGRKDQVVEVGIKYNFDINKFRKSFAYFKHILHAVRGMCRRVDTDATANRQL